ncbi:hypothetical protein L1887_37754 [Cichorium endivia]|nr:hypothetical protein L1887_37754 [Cichorium endivia]
MTFVIKLLFLPQSTASNRLCNAYYCLLEQESSMLKASKSVELLVLFHWFDQEETCGELKVGIGRWLLD